MTKTIGRAHGAPAVSRTTRTAPARVTGTPAPRTPADGFRPAKRGPVSLNPGPVQTSSRGGSNIKVAQNIKSGPIFREILGRLKQPEILALARGGVNVKTVYSALTGRKPELTRRLDEVFQQRAFDLSKLKTPSSLVDALRDAATSLGRPFIMKMARGGTNPRLDGAQRTA